MDHILFKPISLSVISLAFLLAFNLGFSWGGQIYKWVDAEGTVHMTDNLASIPPQYRNQIVTKNLQVAPAPDLQTGIARENTGQAAGLKRFEVPYQAFEGTSRRIIIPVVFNESVTARLLLDTGSPGLMISPKLASRLDLLDEQAGNLMIVTKGIGGAAPAMLSVVDTVSVGEARAEFLPATIAKIPSNEFEGLVGMDFLANYRISIDSVNNVLAFYEMPPDPNKPGGHDEAWWRSNFKSFSGLRDRWGDYLKKVGSINLTSSETDRISKIIRNQYDQADKLYRKLESYASNNAVPIAWRH